MKFKLILTLLLFTASLFATTFSTSVSNKHDDAEQEVGNNKAYLSSSDLELVYDSHEQIIGIRFINVDIPKTASITNAYIRFKAKSSQDDSLSLKISAEDTGNSKRFEAKKKNISDRSKTASISWDNVEAWRKNNFYNTPDIKTLVEDVITRDDWSQNNPITFFIEKKNTRHIRRAYTKDGGSAPELFIEYTTGSDNSSNADICYSDPYPEGISSFSICTKIGGLNCRNIIPIANTSGNELTNIKVYLQSQGIMQASFNEDAGVKDGEGSASIKSDATAGPISALGKNITYTLDNMTSDSSDTRDTYTESTMGIDFTDSVLYSTYTKDGVNYNIEVSPCETAVIAPVLSVGDESLQTSSDPQTMTFTVAISPDTQNDSSTVHYHTEDGTAIAGTDYTAVDDTLTIPAGVSSIKIEISVAANAKGNFQLILDKPYNAGIADGNATGDISDVLVCQNYDVGDSSYDIDIGDLPDQVSNIESQGDVIQSMNHVDNNRTACIYGSSVNDDYDYYYFQADVDGRLDITRSSPNGNDYHLKITTDNGYSYGTRDPQDDPIQSVGMHAGDSIYFRIKETGSDTDEYQLNFNFVTGVNIAGDRPFTIRNPKPTRNIKGNYQIAGNMSLCEDDGHGECRNDNSNSNSRPDIYVDIDTDDTTHNSSSSTINIPANSKVVWAGLYWQGVVHRSRSEDGGHDFMGGTVPDNAPLLGAETNQIDLSDNTYKADEVKFQIPNDTEYRIIKAEQLDYSKLGYGGFAEVTDIVSANPNGSYMIADVKCHEGSEPNHGNYGAWSLVVIYENEDEPLKNITLFDGFATIDSSYKNDLLIDGFLTPSTEPINSKIAFFTMDGEGGPNSLTIVSEKKGSKKVEHLPENPANELFNSTVTGIDSRFPDVAPLRFDLDIIDITNYLAPLETKAILQPRSGGDRYTASFFIMSTELYEPRVCYYIDSIVGTTNNEKIFENGKFISDITSNEEYTFNIWVSNMKKEVTDVNLEDAQEVQVYMKTKDFSYTRNSTKIQNVNESSESFISDISGDDIGEYSSDLNTWRLGEGADQTQGGELIPASSFSDTANKAFITFKGSLDTADAQNIDLTDYLDFTASFKTLTVTIKPEDAKALFQCQDLNSSGSVGGAPSGAFNIVNSAFPNTQHSDPILTSNSTSYEKSLNAISTQVTNRVIYAKVLSLDTNNMTLKNYSGDVNISIIPTPNYDDTKSEDYNQGLCDNSNTPLSTVQTFTFNNEDRIDIAFTNITSAIKNASFRIQYQNGNDIKYACSRDFFAIRPDKFILNAGTENINLLKSGVEHNLSLIASQFNSTNASPNYNIVNAQNIFPNLDNNKTVYAPDGTLLTNGTLKFGNSNFDIVNGSANNIVGLNFDDIGKVDIRLLDTNWSKIDIDNNDTAADCSANGAYICGDINATFIPDHFSISNISLNNFTKDATAHPFTYLSNDLNISAAIKMTVQAENGATPPQKTKNFDTASWENDVTVTLTVTPPAGQTLQKSEIATPVKLGFNNGNYTISNTEVNNSKKLIFNFNRASDTFVNPFQIDGTAVTATISSTYTSAADSVIVSGNSQATANAIFVYGRTHATRQRFTGNTGTATIYFENYCYGSACHKSLLPDSINSNTSDDPRWFINTKHFNDAGTVGTVSEKRGSSVSVGTITGTDTANVALTYEDADTKGYPYKTTLENNASTWLIYNKYNNHADSNEFEVEFINSDANWAGVHETNATTDTNASRKTNRRTMW